MTCSHTKYEGCPPCPCATKPPVQGGERSTDAAKHGETAIERSAVTGLKVLGKTADGEWCYISGLGTTGLGEMWQQSQFCSTFNGIDTDVVLEKRNDWVAVSEGTPETITITISREDAEAYVMPESYLSHFIRDARIAVYDALQAALEDEG